MNYSIGALSAEPPSQVPCPRRPPSYRCYTYKKINLLGLEREGSLATQIDLSTRVSSVCLLPIPREGLLETHTPHKKVLEQVFCTQ